MYQESKSHRIVSTIVVIAMLLQLFTPFAIIAPETAVYAAQSSAAPTQSPPLPTSPAPLLPLTISRQQSTFQADGGLTVTYTVHNNLSPTVRPDIAPNATITDTIAAIDAADFAADANSVRGVQLILQPTDAQTSFQSASLPVDQDGSAFAFNLGDVPPLGEATVVITLTAPTNTAVFMELDGGAASYGNWRGRAVNATATPITLAPDGFDQWLVCTIDANCDDSFVLEQTAQFDNPAAIFEFVRGLGYESYIGSLRGARGTLWSEAGNATDQASLLIALLRASGIPAAYRQGSLDQTDAQTLIASMFPPVVAVSGHIPAGTETADPVNDPALIAEAQDHVWVEAYLPGSGWTTLDPSFPAAQMGDLFGTPTGSQLAELPDDVRHKVTVALEVEKYSQFPVGGTNLYTIQPLTATFNIVELVGEPLVFAHVVETYNPGGLVYSTVEHTYTPYFLVGESARLVEGEAFTELISSFPFGLDFAVGEWLDFTLTDPAGNSETYRRELFDDIGYAVRINGGLINDLERDETARLSIMSSWATLFAPSDVPTAAINNAYQEMVALTEEGIIAHEAAMQMVDTNNPTAEEAELAKETITTFGKISRLAQRLHLLKFAAASSQSHDYIADAMLVKAYPDAPRLFTTGWERNDIEETDNISFDLMRNHVRSITYPGQTEDGAGGFLFWRALLDMSVEHEILAEIAPAPLTSVSAVFSKAIEDDVPFERITFGRLDYLATMPISEQAKARITTALTENSDQYVLLPSQMILLDGTTEPTIGWLAIDNESQQVVDMMEDGQHGAAVDYAALAKFSKKAGSFLGGFAAGLFAHTMGFWVGFFEQMPLGDQDIAGVIASAKGTAAEMGKEAEKACDRIGDEDWCKRGTSAGNAVGAAVLNRSDPPLQEALFVLPLDEPETVAETAVSITFPATLNGTVATNVNTEMSAIYGTADHNWTTTAQNSFVFDELTAVSADLFVNGGLVDSGAMSVISATATLSGAGVAISGTADGNIALHAAALTDLGAGSQFDNTNFDLSAANYTLSFNEEAVTVNGNSYSGDVELIVSGTAVLNGAGATAAPNFATGTTITPVNGGVTVADATGGLTVGGTAVSPENGFALGNANSAATITPAGATDSFNYNGAADFFSMSLSANSSTVPADSPAVFTANIAANFGDTYTMTVIAPDGWDVTADASGNITAQPPIGAAVDDYAVLVTAQSAIYPDLFVSAAYVVSVTAVNGVSVTIAPDPAFTVPWGTAHDDINFIPTLGQVQIPDAAFAATIQNRSTIARTFDVTVNGLPAGWTIFGAEEGRTTLQLPLEAGERVQLGLYVLPTTAVLPNAGAAYPFSITATATDDGAVTGTGNETFTMPAIPYPALAIDPAAIYTAPNSEVAFDVTITNIGNSAGSFDLTSSLPVNNWTLSALQSPIALAPDQSATQVVTVTVVTGTFGIDHPVAIGAAAPTVPYTPTTAVNIYLVSALTEPLFHAANSCTMDSIALAAALEALAFAVTDLESSCDAGSCDLDERDAVVTAAESVAQYARIASRAVSYAAIETIAADMATHTSNVDLEADMDDLSAAIGTLSLELCNLEEHQPIARFTPYVDAILLGDSASSSLDVTNSGTLSTAYAITITGLPDGDQFFNQTINAGAMVSLPINSTPATLGAFDVEATVTAVGSFTLTPQTTAVSRLNVVDKFLQVTQVTADPDFVETGVSSTTISVEIANIAGVGWPAEAETAVIAPNGTTLFSNTTSITALAGTPRWYELATVDSSGWAEGVYTVTVNLLNGGGALIPDGSGYGYFSVGQAIIASQAVTPDVVAPGTVTVTMIITTAITADIIVPPPLLVAEESGGKTQETGYPAEFLATLPAVDSDSLTEGLPLDDLYAAYQEQLTSNNEQLTSNERPFTPVYTPPVTKTAVLTDVAVSESNSPLSILNSQLSINSVFTRTEQAEPAVVYTGTWTNFNYNRASGGNYYRADDTGETAVFTFSGDWLNIGFIGSRYSGHAEIFIDGSSQGVIDLYRRDETAVSYLYDGLINATHTVTVTVLGVGNPYASNDYVQLDYFDAWDSSTLPDGTFEQNDSRVIVSSGWTTYTDAIASGGSYIRDDVGTIWFPFTGDSFSYHAINRASGLKHTQLIVDGQYLTDLNTFNYDTITRTYSFDGFGAGSHILQVSTYRGNSNVDAFTTPAIASIDNPELTGSYIRYEEDHPNWLYNGVPFTQTIQSWTRRDYGAADKASDDQAIFSGAAANTASITVNGQRINIGFAADFNSGSADIYLDGAYQRTVNLYRNGNSVTSEFFPALSAGNHTISVTVVGDGNVWIDYVDVWDGSALPDATYETFPGQFYLSAPWSRISDVNAINGDYLRTNGGTAWFPFTGDSVSYRAFAYNSADKARLYLDDQFVGTLDLFNSSDISRTFSFDGLGAGVHILRLEHHRGNITLENFSSPGVAPFYNSPAPSGIIRYEEDDPALRYNGVPLTQTVASWDSSTYKQFASDGYYADSNTIGNNVSLDFNGTWVGVGFLTWRTRGIADIYLDGNLIDSIDLFTHKQDTKSVYYDGLTNTSHTISVTVSGNSHPHATNTEIAIDYIDVWDGTLETDGTFEETDRDRITYSFGWSQTSEANASGGSYAETGISGDNTAWFPFTGDSVSYQAWARRSIAEMEIKIDGVNIGQNGQEFFDIFADVPITRTFSFDGLGAGPHVMEINMYRDELTLDNFSTPGIAPFYMPPPTSTGIIRYEEDDPALLYNGFPFEQNCYPCWSMNWDRSSSNVYVAETQQVNDWVELTFNGRWAGVGFATGTNGGVVEVFIDGTSMLTVSLTSPQDVKSVYFSDLITGTHTISASLLSGRMYFDFFDTWDGTEMGDGWFDPDLDEHDGPYYYSDLNSWKTVLPTQSFAGRIQYARNDDVLDRATISHNTHMWFGFTGNDLEFLPFQKAGDTVEVFIDGVSQGVIDLTPEYSDQPIALYYTDLGDGPHMVHLNAADSPRIDAFQVNPPNFLPYTPQVEWMSAAPTDIYTTTLASGGLLSTAAIGDLDGDGLVEIVMPSKNGQLYVYRGDGQDAGGGSPILWQSGLVGAGAEPTLADLDGDGKAEIIVMGTNGTAAFHHDGTVYWFTDTIKSQVENAGWAGSSVANLDLEPGPEIVLAAYNDALYVLDHDGSLLFSEPTGTFPAVPTLADVTGDGFLDIIFAQDKTITVYDAFNGYNIAWTRTHTYAGSYGQAFGSPAVIDVDGKQPGGDDGPEVVINWGHYVDVLDADGTPLWNYYLGADSYRRPSPITIADVDGDNEIEILTASAFQSGFLVLHHLLVAINADGTLLWSEQMGDTTASASGVSTQDLDGDGVWEVLWNGYNEGFTILNGPTGEKLFNEEFTESGTFVDYPAVGDVDGDGYAEIVTGGVNGMYVIGHDEIWGDSRPVWNQHNYHVTNINDDWSVPVSEPNAWDIHNTYRTQTPDREPTPAYQINLTYTAGIDNITVLTPTASISLTGTPPTYTWNYHQEWVQPVVTTTFDSVLTNMRPGETRMVSAGTEIAYRLPSGYNYLTLPPLYVTAPHIVSIAPETEMVWAGLTAVYTLTLTNPAATADNYAIAISGVPTDWISATASVPIAADSTVVVPITVTVPPDTAIDTLPIIADVTNDNGGTDAAIAYLSIGNALQIALAPSQQSAYVGNPVTYTLTISNIDSIAHSYALTATGLADVSLPVSVTVLGGGNESVTFPAGAPAGGAQPFTVQAMADNGIGKSVDGVVDGLLVGVELALAPEPVVTGAGSTTVFTLTVTNTSDSIETFNLLPTVPAGWSAELMANGTAVNAVTLSPDIFNTAEFLLLVTPDAAAVVADYEVMVTAVSQNAPNASATISGTVQVLPLGVQINILSGPTAIDPTGSAVWQVEVTNSGTTADTFDLQLAGVFALASQFSTDVVSLAAGASQTVQVTTANMVFMMPGVTPLVVAATSQADGRVQHQDILDVAVGSFEGVDIAWQPATQTVTDTLSAGFTLVISNTGNVATTYDVVMNTSSTVDNAVPVTVSIPAHSSIILPIMVTADGIGTWLIEAVVLSESGGVNGGETAVLIVADDRIVIYLPVILK